MIIQEELKKINIKEKKINIFMDNQNNECILIDKVEIYLRKENFSSKEEVQKILKEKLNVNVEVVV